LWFSINSRLKSNLILELNTFLLLVLEFFKCSEGSKLTKNIMVLSLVLNFADDIQITTICNNNKSNNFTYLGMTECLHTRLEFI